MPFIKKLVSFSPIRIVLPAAFSLIALTACDSSELDPLPPLPALPDSTAELRAVVEDLSLTGNPASGRALPSIDEPAAQLGMQVFFTKSLALNGLDAACVTCHHPVLGGGDNLSLSVGVDAENPDLLGQGRFHSVTGTHFDGGPPVPRNAPTTFNIGLWDRSIFHDGRIEALDPTAGQNGNTNGIRTPDSAFNVADLNAGGNLTEAQARFPVTSREEMRGFGDTLPDNDTLRAELATVVLPPSWNDEFDAVYGGTDGVAGTDPANPYARIAEVIAAYERSQVFVDNPWSAFVGGADSAISESAKRGALLFFRDYDDGGANCAACHSGDFFTNEGFHNYAMPQIGRGKGDESGTGIGDNDFGRFRETGDTADMFAFRTPSLLNVAVTGPWSHAGAYTSLEAVIRHKANPEEAINSFDFSQLNPNLQASNMLINTQAAIAAGIDPLIEVIELSDENVADLVAFLETLTDPCVTDRACIGQWIPDASDPNPDALRLNAIDTTGNPL